MDRKKYYHLSNEMLTVTLIANIIGDRAINILSRTMFERSLYDTIQFIHKIDSIFLSCSFLFLIMAILWYERPVRLALKKICKQESVDQGRMLKARQRLLNEPYYIIIIDLVIWIAAAIVYGFGVKFSGQHSSIVRLLVMQSLITGLITVTLTFFWLEHILQKRLAPIFFPNGKLYITPGIVRIRVGTRLIALVMAGSIIPLLAIHFTIHGSIRTLNRGVVEPLVILEKLQDIIENMIVLYGGMKASVRSEMNAKLSEVNGAGTRLILATGSYIGEGFDDPSLDTLFLTMPISFKGKIVQYSGRLHRLYKGKTETRIYDYLDSNIPVLQRMYSRRIKAYKALGYAESNFRI